MSSEAADGGLRACPYCRGTIQAAAILCRHCKRRLDGPVVAPPTAVALPAPPPTIARPAPPATMDRPAPQVSVSEGVTMMLEFLSERGVADTDSIRRVLLASHAGSAKDAMDECIAAGLVARAQRGALLPAFREKQIQACTAILNEVVDRHWLSADMVPSALLSFEPKLFTSSPTSFLIAEGLITLGQAKQLWASSSPHARNAGHPAASSSRQPASSTLGKKPLILLGAALTGCFWISVLVALASGVMGETIRPDCTMSGNGSGTCSFTNTEFFSSDASCGTIEVTCRYGNGLPGQRSSSLFCSGEVASSMTETVAFTVAEMDRIRPSYGDWRDSCSFIWRANDD